MSLPHVTRHTHVFIFDSFSNRPFHGLFQVLIKTQLARTLRLTKFKGDTLKESENIAPQVAKFYRRLIADDLPPTVQASAW